MFSIDRMAKLRPYLLSEIKGQSSAVMKASSVLERGMFQLSSPDRPLGSFLFVGPTGVGKTELTKCFTNYLFEGSNRLIRFDMSEYQNKAQLDVLLGDAGNPQGQIGRLFDGNKDEEGELRGGTVLFDEIEKAHPDLLLILLQVLEDGRLTLRDGTLLNLSKFFVVMTSNIGASEAMEMRKSTQETVERVVSSLVKEKLRPELVGRITEQVVFSRLEYEVQVEIAELMLGREVERLSKALNASIKFDKEVLELVLVEGFDSRFGARPLRRCIDRLLGDALVEQLILRNKPDGMLVVEGDKVRLELSSVS